MLHTIKLAPESEKIVLGGLLLDDSLYATIKEKLCENDFCVPVHSRIFHIMGELFKKNSCFDIPMILNEMGFNELYESYLYHLSNTCPSTKNLNSHAAIIREKSVQRQLIKVAEEIAEGCKDEKQEALAMLSKAEKKVLEIHHASLVHGCPYKERLVNFMRELTEEIAESEMKEEYLHECIVEINKAFVRTLDHFEEHDE